MLTKHINNTKLFRRENGKLDFHYRSKRIIHEKLENVISAGVKITGIYLHINHILFMYTINTCCE